MKKHQQSDTEDAWHPVVAEPPTTGTPVLCLMPDGTQKPGTLFPGGWEIRDAAATTWIGSEWKALHPTHWKPLWQHGYVEAFESTAAKCRICSKPPGAH